MIDVQCREVVVGLSPLILSMIEKAAESAIKLAGKDATTAEVTIVLSDDEELAALNQQFRGISGPTDVLSFESELDFPELAEEVGGYLGDIVISVPTAQRQGEEAGHGLAAELATLAAHGTLHLLGYDHADAESQKQMWQLQEQAAREALGGQTTSPYDQR